MVRAVVGLVLVGAAACSSSSPGTPDNGSSRDRSAVDRASDGPRPVTEARAGEARAADLKAPVPAHWETVPGTLAAKDHTATLLKDGRVLIVGGRTNTGSPPVSAKTTLFDPKSSSLLPGPALKQARMGHTATLLSDGRVLVVGGSSDSGTTVASSEIFDPAAGSWSDGPAMPSGRTGHTATLVSGNVLVVGGYGGGKHLGSLLLYKFAAGGPGAWASVAAVLTTPRSAHAVVALPNGTLLVMGGAGDTKILDSIEMYDPSTGGLTVLGTKLSEPRNLLTASVLPSGKILIVGGNNATHDDLYDPTVDKVTAVSHLGDPPEEHAAVTLLDGRVLVCGSAINPGARAEVFSSEAGGTWTATAAMKAARFDHSATLLADGSVLVVGGFYPEWTFTTAVERYYP